MADYNPYGKTNIKSLENKFGYKQPTVGSVFSNASMAIPVTGLLKVGTTVIGAFNKAKNLKASHEAYTKSLISKNNLEKAEVLKKIGNIAKNETDSFINKGVISPIDKIKYKNVKKTLNESRTLIMGTTDKVNRQLVSNLLMDNKKINKAVRRSTAGSVVGDVLGSYGAYKYVDGKINGK